MQIDFLVGRVMSVDTFRKMSSGEIVPMIKIRSYLDGTDVEVPWLPVGPQQFMPVAGQDVLYYCFNGRSYRMVCFHGTNPSWIRKGKFGLNEGEFVVQADAGLGYIKGSKDGSVEISSGDSVTDVLLSDDGLQAFSPSFSLATYGGASLVIQEDSTISLERKSKDGTLLAGISLDKDNNAKVEAQGDVTIKATNILLDGKVKFGPGASDPSQDLNFGPVVTAGPTGTWPFDLVTGTPIQGTPVVRASR